MTALSPSAEWYEAPDNDWTDCDQCRCGILVDDARTVAGRVLCEACAETETSSRESRTMTTKTQTFKQYTWSEFDLRSADGLAESGVDWDAYGDDWAVVMQAAGFDPDDEECAVGVLTQEWNGHPEGAVIVSGLSIAGYPFAVANAETLPITAADIEDLLSRQERSEAQLIRYQDTGEIGVVAAALLTDISYSERDREYETIATAADLRSQGDWDIENPTAADFEAFAEMLNAN